jgi:hypothetical protein
MVDKELLLSQSFDSQRVSHEINWGGTSMQDFAGWAMMRIVTMSLKRRSLLHLHCRQGCQRHFFEPDNWSALHYSRSGCSDNFWVCQKIELVIIADCPDPIEIIRFLDCLLVERFLATSLSVKSVWCQIIDEWEFFSSNASYDTACDLSVSIRDITLTLGRSFWVRAPGMSGAVFCSTDSKIWQINE